MARCSTNSCKNYVRVAYDGVGDLLFFPLFYTDSAGSYTRISVVNTSERFAVVADVAVKDAVCAEVLASFYIYLLPNDAWSGYIVKNGGKVSLVSYDDSVLAGGKVASSSAPFSVDFSKPKNPASDTRFGYVEVVALAYVDTHYVNPGNSTDTYNYLMTSNGFTEEHLFVNWLFGAKDTYNDVAYVDDNGTKRFSGIIFPADAHSGFYDYNPVFVKGVVSKELEDGTLSGWADIFVNGYGVASYRAVAVKDFVMLGDDVVALNNSLKDLRGHYKPTPSEAAYLDNVGDVNLLDAALAKKRVMFHYTRLQEMVPFMFLLFPTKQMAYDPTTGKCVATEHTSYVWQDDGILEVQGLDVVTISDEGEAKKCAFYPCIWDNTALLSIARTDFGFDPFLFSSGWLEVLFASPDKDVVKFAFADDSSKMQKWSEINALPVIALAGYLGEGFVSLFYPSYRLPWNEVCVFAKAYGEESVFHTLPYR